MLPTYDDVAAAHDCMVRTVKRTPVFTSSTIDALTRAQVFFKCENFQRTGAFKLRGAFNAMAPLNEKEKRYGVVAASGGNHAQAVALCGKLLSIPVVLFMPDDAPRVKVNAARAYGAEIVEYQDPLMRLELTRKVAEERGCTIIPSHDDARIIAGQGTVAKELLEDIGPLDVLLVPVGGGGLIAGCATTTKALAPACKVIGVEPAAGNDGALSFRERKRVEIPPPSTIADGARLPSLGELPFRVILKHVDEFQTVSDEALLNAMLFLWERMKIIVEPTGALAATALLHGVSSGAHPFRGQRVGVVLSGGNVDLGWMAERAIGWSGINGATTSPSTGTGLVNTQGQ